MTLNKAWYEMVSEMKRHSWDQCHKNYDKVTVKSKGLCNFKVRLQSVTLKRVLNEVQQQRKLTGSMIQKQQQKLNT